MSTELQVEVTRVFDQIADDIKALNSSIAIATEARGDLAALNTAAPSLVSAINALEASVGSFTGYTDADADARVQAAKGTFAAPSTIEWASTQLLVDQLTALKDDILGADVNAALDTLVEIGTELGSQDSAVQNLITGQAKRIKVDGAQSFTLAEKNQAAQNMGIGDVDHDYLTPYIARRDAP